MKQKLTLKNNKKSGDKFRSLNICPAGKRKIAITQTMFEKFWKELSLIECSEHEKNLALDKLRESCYWFNRGIAEYHETTELFLDNK